MELERLKGAAAHGLPSKRRRVDIDLVQQTKRELERLRGGDDDALPSKRRRVEEAKQQPDRDRPVAKRRRGALFSPGPTMDDMVERDAEDGIRAIIRDGKKESGFDRTAFNEAVRDAIREYNQKQGVGGWGVFAEKI